ncbi:hypothetical protein PIB30_085522 [Stylosanthes scabra]|uniref:Uncharacterized protein n=1 Tax=Stylosanthes scabra TaxID=79078 RepID=A0ABU6WWD6_9FABA|nr:hypothetical protein [Stylosanthes scabra]
MSWERLEPVNPMRKNEERKLADQETKLGSKTEQDSTHMRGRARICVLLIPQLTPKRTTSTHMRGKHTASMKRSSQSCLNMVPSPEDPRTCVEVHAYAWKATSVTFLVTFWRSKRDPA